MSESHELTLDEICDLAMKIAGDISVYQVRGAVYKVLYYSPSTPAVQGMTDEEYRAMLSNNASDSMMEADKMRLYLAVKKGLENHEEMECSYRLIHKTKGYVWVRARGKAIGTYEGYPVLLVNFSNTSAETEFYSGVLDYAPTQVVVCDRSTHEVLYTNAAARTALKTSDIIGKPCYKVMRDREGACSDCRVPDMTRDGLVEYDNHDDVSGRWSHVSAKLVSWCGFEAFVMFTDDVTAERQEESKFRDSLKALLAANPQALCTFKLNLTRNTCDLSYKSPIYPDELASAATVDDLVDKVASHIADPRQRCLFVENSSRKGLLARFSAGDSTVATTYQRTAEDGEIHWITTTNSMVRNPATMDVLSIVTTQMTDDEAVREQIVNHVTGKDFDYIAVIYPRESTIRIYYFNRGVRMALSPEEKLNRLDYEYVCNSAADVWIAPGSRPGFDRNRAIPTIIENLERDGTYAYEIDAIGNEGEPRRKRLSYVFLDASKQTILVSQRDITALAREQRARQRELSEQLRREQALRDEANRANQAKSEFLSRISHDIRTPMNVISSMTDFAFEDIDDREKLEHDLHEIKVSNTFLLSLINDILDLSKIDSGTMELHPEMYTLEEFEENARGLLGPICRARGIDFQIVEKSTVPVIYVDKVRINQVILNLLSNSVKFTPRGGSIRLVIDGQTNPDDARTMIIDVEDNGLGMSREFQRRMFEPFAQENLKKEQLLTDRGTGLGLPIVKKIVDLAGGSIDVRSDLGKGTTFSVRWTVPTRGTPSGDDGKDEQERLFDGKSFAGKRILVAEDHPINAQITERLLEAKGAQPVIAEDGMAVLDAFRASAPGEYDAILMDIQMPTMNGYDAATAIRSLGRPDARTIPIIAMTADAYAEDVRRALDAGMNAHVAKPIDPDALYEELDRQINPS